MAAMLALSAFLPSLSGARAPLAPDEVKVWVLLKDKGSARDPVPGTSFPAHRAGHGLHGDRDRRVRAYEDLAVHEPYVEALAAEGLACETRLKWQNRVSGRIRRSRLPALARLPFVAGVSELPRKAPRSRPAPWLPGLLLKGNAAVTPSPVPDLGVFGALAESLHVREVLEWMDGSGLRPGQGMRVAVMDADFDLGHEAFDRIRQEGRIKDQYDFVEGKAQAVTSGLGDSHGAQCLSLIGGSLPGKIVGSAAEADFLLYRTEDGDRESYAEEDYLAAAIERAVDSGAQVISISVVYRTEFDSTPDIPLVQMDGRTRPSSLAAAGAARRNVLVVVAMGNLDGSQSGPSTLSVPADADGVLAVGIVDTAGAPCGYSTTGPTVDGRIKPEVVSMGLVPGCRVEMAAPFTRNGVTAAQGTSFAAPAIAGIAVLLRQAQPSRTAAEIRASLLATARNAAQPNSQIGWGLVDAWAALGRPQVSVRPFARLRAVPPAGLSGPGHDAAGRRLPPGPSAAGIRFSPRP